MIRLWLITKFKKNFIVYLKFFYYEILFKDLSKNTLKLNSLCLSELSMEY